MLRPSGADRDIHERHRPEETPLYRIVETCYPKFLARLEAEGASLPHFVQQEFDDTLKCGLLEHGFLRVKCDACRHEHLVAFSCKRRGFRQLGKVIEGVKFDDGTEAIEGSRAAA